MGSCNEDWFCTSCLSSILPFITCDNDTCMSDVRVTLNYSDFILNRANYLFTKFCILDNVCNTMHISDRMEDDVISNRV